MTEVRCPECNHLAGKVEEGIFVAMVTKDTDERKKTRTAYVIRQGTVECCGSEIYHVNSTPVPEFE